MALAPAASVIRLTKCVITPQKKVFTGISSRHIPGSCPDVTRSSVPTLACHLNFAVDAVDEYRFLKPDPIERISNYLLRKQYKLLRGVFNSNILAVNNMED